jgi:hypothetical protein
MAENRVNSHDVYDYDLHRQLKFLQKREKAVSYDRESVNSW